MSFNYNGFSHYSSAFNEELRKFSELLGYGKNDTVSLYQEPILPSDSLLGIKYVFADNDYPGLVQISDVEKMGKVYTRILMCFLWDSGHRKTAGR